MAAVKGTNLSEEGNNTFSPMTLSTETPDFPVLSTTAQQQAAKAENPTKHDPQHPDWDPFSVVSPEKAKPAQALPPKLTVRLSTHEEVTANLKMALDELDTTTELTVEGTVYAQVQCSDARRNAPFALVVPQVPGDQNLQVQPNGKYTVARNATRNCPMLVSIPKQDIASVPIAYYTKQNEVKFMPVLVERKITRNGRRLRIAVQIRSRLDNLGDMKDLTILVAVPEKVNGDTVTVTRGKGMWDDIKRTIKWGVPYLTKGESTLVMAEAELWNHPSADEDETPFPVLFRCSSISDPIKPMDWRLAQVSSCPANISALPSKHTFRLLHRLP